MIFPYEKFAAIINILRDKYDKMGEISKVLNWCGMYDISMGDQVVDVLTYIFNDEGNWISYWMFERDFGRDWHDGCVTNSDGTDIDLSTVQKLYDFLVQNMQTEH